MTKAEFARLEVGDYVQITQHGQNKGKVGIISWFSSYRSACLVPYNCSFNFYNPRKKYSNGLYSFSHVSFKYLGKKPADLSKVPKYFSATKLYGKEGIDWPTSNFTNTELKVIDRFLQELTDHTLDVLKTLVIIVDNNT